MEWVVANILCSQIYAFLLPRCLVSRASFFSSLVRGKSNPRRVREGVTVAAGEGVCGSTPPAPPLLLSQVPRTVEAAADGLGWTRWTPVCPLPPLSLQPRGMGRGCGPLQSGSSPSIFLEGAEELVAMETEKRQEGMQGNTEVGLKSTP